MFFVISTFLSLLFHADTPIFLFESLNIFHVSGQVIPGSCEEFLSVRLPGFLCVYLVTSLPNGNCHCMAHSSNITQ